MKVYEQIHQFIVDQIVGMIEIDIGNYLSE